VTAFCGCIVEKAHTYVQVPRGSNGRLTKRPSKQAVLQKSPDLCLKRSRSNPDKADARQTSRNNDECGSYGDPVLEWRRPGGSAIAVMGRGRKHTLACRQVARALATLKQGSKAYITSLDSVRKNEIARESMRIEESATSPELAKDPPVTGRCDECESLGQVVGAQGVLTQPE